MSGVLLLGGTSEIGLAIVRALVADGARRVMLAGRDAGALAAAAASIEHAGDVATLTLDAVDTAAHAGLIDEAARSLGGLEVVVLAVGVLGGAEDDDPVDVLRVNALGAGSLLLAAAERLCAQGTGTLVVLSSAAAVRARRSNPAYGASKAALDQLALATADRVRDSGARVLVVRPGFVHTRMTSHLPGAPLSASAEQVAGAVLTALRGRARIVWVPAAMGAAMAVVRALPSPIFRRLPW